MSKFLKNLMCYYYLKQSALDLINYDSPKKEKKNVDMILVPDYKLYL